MLVEVLKALAVTYRLWHAKHRLISTLLLAVATLVVLQIAWSVFWWITAFASPGRQRHAVAGRVTWQGQPLANGIISFRPLDDQPFDSGAVVQQGSFKIPPDKGLTPGPYLVRIHASIADPSLPPPAAGERDMRSGIEILPSKYNTDSELKAEIGRWGRTIVSFDLRP
jgi:hypothetical protein